MTSQSEQHFTTTLYILDKRLQLLEIPLQGIIQVLENGRGLELSRNLERISL